MKSKGCGRPGFKNIFYIEDNGEIFTFYCESVLKVACFWI
jgi:hypothetical protein